MTADSGAIFNKPFYIDTSAIVDGTKWYSTFVSPEIHRWLKDQDSELYCIHQTATKTYCVDMHEKLFLVMVLIWG